MIAEALSWRCAAGQHLESRDMQRAAALALFGLALAVTSITPPKAVAQIPSAARIATPEPNGAVVIQPASYVAYDEAYFLSHNWNSGYHEGYYYGHGQRYRKDLRGFRHYDDRYRSERRDRDHGQGRWLGRDRGHDPR